MVTFSLSPGSRTSAEAGGTEQNGQELSCCKTYPLRNVIAPASLDLARAAEVGKGPRSRVGGSLAPCPAFMDSSPCMWPQLGDLTWLSRRLGTSGKNGCQHCQVWGANGGSFLLAPRAPSP